MGGAGIFKTANTILTAANLDAGSTFAVGKDYYVYICDSRIDSADEKYVISLNSTYPTGWNATNSRKIGGFHYGRCRKVDSNLQPLNGSSVIFGTGWESAVSNAILEMLQEVIKWDKTATKSHLYTVDTALQESKELLRLAHDLKYSAMNARHYGESCRKLKEIGVMLGELIEEVKTRK